MPKRAGTRVRAGSSTPRSGSPCALLQTCSTAPGGHWRGHCLGQPWITALPAATGLAPAAGPPRPPTYQSRCRACAARCKRSTARSRRRLPPRRRPARRRSRPGRYPSHKTDHEQYARQDLVTLGRRHRACKHLFGDPGARAPPAGDLDCSDFDTQEEAQAGPGRGPVLPARAGRRRRRDRLREPVVGWATQW